MKSAYEVPRYDKILNVCGCTHSIPTHPISFEVDDQVSRVRQLLWVSRKRTREGCVSFHISFDMTPHFVHFGAAGDVS